MKKHKERISITDQLPNDRQLCELFHKQHRPMRLDALIRAANLPRGCKKLLEERLRALEDAGHIVRMRGGAWAASSLMRSIVGRYAVTLSGAAFVTPLDVNEHGHRIFDRDIFIHPSQSGGAWHGDLVRVTLLPGAARGKNPEGRIAGIVERGQKEVPARVEALRGLTALCRPTDPRLTVLFEADASALERRPRMGDLLLVTPETEITPDLWQGSVLSSFGGEEQVPVQESLVKLNHQVPADFPQRVLDEAAALPPAPLDADMAGREDLRDIPFVTIDGRTARDFDDAVHVSPLAGGGWLLRVGIADVTRYVHPGSALDREALARGNSWYFPTSVEPMLPPALSNGLCSLNPGVDRLIMLVEIPFTAQGQPGTARFAAAVMRSAARLTYGQVTRLLQQTSPADECASLLASPRGAELLAMLREARALADVLHRAREARGSLDFELPEPEYDIDAQGNLRALRFRERTFAHRLIEECMIAANEAVARFLTEKGIPFLYRVHPEPEEDRLHALFTTLRTTPLAPSLPRIPAATALQGILREAQGTPQEFLAGHLILRSMAQARYQPINEGHFGLASPCYCHFTSPIRRYADMVVHRALKKALGLPGSAALAEHKLLRTGDQLNRRERAAMEAEREISRRLACLALREHTGEILDGTIAAVTDFGMFVELASMPAEGMVRVEDLGDDYYEYDAERQELLGVGTGRRFRLGQSVRVRVADVNLGRLEIRLLVEGIADAGERRRHGGRGAPARKGRGAPRGGRKSGKQASGFRQDAPRKKSRRRS